MDVSVSASSVRPWKPGSNAITAPRPVARRAILTAFSTASAPLLNSAALRGPPETGAISQAEFDVWVPLLSLPLYFGTDIATVPAEVPYLSVDPRRTAAWRKRYDAAGRPGMPKVGLVFRANPESASASVNVLQNPDLTITKTADVASVDAAGDLINYTVTVANTGNMTLTGLTVADPLVTNLALASGDANNDGKLDLTETWTYFGSYTVLQSDIDRACFAASFPCIGVLWCSRSSRRASRWVGRWPEYEPAELAGPYPQPIRNAPITIANVIHCPFVRFLFFIKVPKMGKRTIKTQTAPNNAETFSIPNPKATLFKKKSQNFHLFGNVNRGW